MYCLTCPIMTPRRDVIGPPTVGENVTDGCHAE